MSDINRSRSRERRNVRSDFKRTHSNSYSGTVEKLRKGRIDYFILLATIFLVLFGVVMVFSASYYYAKNTYNDTLYFFKRQAIWGVIGFICMIFVSNINYNFFRKYSKMLFMISILLLILVLIPGIGKKVKGARRWIELGPVGFQPSEIAKLGIILYLPNFICSRKKILSRLRGFVICLIIPLIPALLVVVEPNASTAMVMMGIAVSIIFVASPKIWYFFIPVIGAIGAVLAMAFGDGFRKKRFMAWLDPFSDPTDKGFQTVQSLLAIGSGGLFGLGLGQSRQKLGFIPEAHNDIIFSIICEELGICGAILLVLLFGVLIWRGYHTAMNATNAYCCYVASGITSMIAIQVILNIAVVTNIIPNTGVPLPFISYGGTSLVIMMSSIGILLSISKVFQEQ